MPETFDLDALFADLEHDISDLTHSPGAARAVRGARRRRRTTIGAAAAGLALVVGSVVAGRGTLGHDSAPPADQVIQMGQLPAAAPFHDASFDSVFAGWESGWFYDDNLGVDHNAPLSLMSSPPCWNKLGSPHGSPRWTTVTKNGTVVSGSRQSTAFLMWTHLRSADAASQGFDTWVSEPGQCAGAVRIRDRAWTGGGEAMTWTVPPPQGVEGNVYLVLAHAGDGFAAGIVGAETKPLPDDVELRLVTRMMAGIQSRESGGPGPSD
jgi:hypothetical protein